MPAVTRAQQRRSERAAAKAGGAAGRQGGTPSPLPSRKVHALSGASPNRRATGTPSPLPPLAEARAAKRASKAQDAGRKRGAPSFRQPGARSPALGPPKVAGGGARARAGGAAAAGGARSSGGGASALANQSGAALYPALRSLWPDPTTQLQWMWKFADCGMNTAEQLVYAVKLASGMSMGLLKLPKEALLQGKLRLINELIMKRTAKGEWINDVDMERILATLQPPKAGAAAEPEPEPESEAGAAPTPDAASIHPLLKTKAEPLARPMDHALLCALLSIERLDLRPKLLQVKVTTVKGFLEQVAGAEDPNVSVLHIPVNKQLREAGQRPIGVDTLKEIAEFVTSPPPMSSLEGCRLDGDRGDTWDIVAQRGAKQIFGRLSMLTKAAKAESDSADAAAAGAAAAMGGALADVLYMEASGSTPVPLVIGVPLGGAAHSSADDDAGGSLPGVRAGKEIRDAGTIALAEEICKRMRSTCGSTPAIVLTTLHPSNVVCSSSLGEGAKGERSETAWRNYHLLIEVAKKRAEAAHEHKSALFVELHSTTEPDVVCQLGYGLPIFPLRSAISAGREAAKVASTPAEKKAEEKAIAASFEMFDKDGSGEIDMQELRSVSQELGVPMSEEDLEQAMGEMDKDGSGEVDVKEFGKWYKSLSERPPGSGGMSKLELLKLKSILAESAVPHLCARQPPPASPADAMVGGASFGAFLEAFGCDATPSPARMDPSGALALSRYNAGSFSIAAHGGKDGAAASDALQLTVPSSYWETAPETAEALGIEGNVPALAQWAARIGTALACFVSAHYNWQTTPGDGISETAVKTDFSKGGRRASVYGDIYPHLLELTSLRDAEREKNSKLRPPSPKMQF